jgi:hypothetical protein
MIDDIKSDENPKIAPKKLQEKGTKKGDQKQKR